MASPSPNWSISSLRQHFFRRKNLVWRWGVMLISGAIAFHFLTLLIFSIIGLSSEDPIYPLRVMLIAILALVGGLTAIAPLLQQKRLALVLVAGVEGLLCGFFWGGVWSGRNSMIATVVGLLGMGVFLIGTQFAYRCGFGVMVRTLGVLFAQGMCFVAGVNALQALFVGQWGLFGGWGFFSLLFLGCTIQNLVQLYRELNAVA